MNASDTKRKRRTILILLTVVALTVAFLGAVAGVTNLVRAQEPPEPELGLVRLLAPGPVTDNSSLTAAPPELRADGVSTTTLTARARNAGNDPVFDAFVGFSSTLGSTNFPQAEAESSAVVTTPESAWTKMTDDAARASGGAYMQTNGATHSTAQASWVFTIPSSAGGRGAVSLRYRTDSNNAIARVEVDGSLAITIDMYAATSAFTETVIKTGLSAGNHTVVVMHTSPSPTKNASSGGLWLQPDLFRSGATPVTSGDDTGNVIATLTSVDFCCGSQQVTATATIIGSLITETAEITMTASEPVTTYSSVTGTSPVVVASTGNRITATVKDKFIQAVPDDTIVTITVSAGTVGKTGSNPGDGGESVTTTPSSGVAWVVFTAPITATDVVVTATAQRLTATYGTAVTATVTCTIDIKADSPFTITVSPSESPVSATTDHVAKTVVITAVISDTYNNLVEDGTVVTFTTSEAAKGQFAPGTRTTSSGRVTTIYTPTIAAVASLTHTITATADSKVGTTTVEVQPGNPYTNTSVIAFTSISTTDESRPRANLSDRIVVTATFSDAISNTVSKPNGDVVTLTVASNVGRWGTSGITTTKTITHGVVVTDLIAGNITGTQVITAELGTVGTVVITKNITFIEPAQNITLTRSETEIRIAGATGDEAIVTATVVDADNNDAPGQVVTFTVSSGTFVDGVASGTPVSKTTTAEGVATATITATLKGTSYITGTTHSVTSHQVTDVISITVRSGDPLTVTIVPASVDLTAEITSTVNAVVSDTYNNLVPNVVVTWTVSEHAGILAGTPGTTDSDGKVTITVVGVVSGTGTITATSEGVSGTANVTTIPGAAYAMTLTTQYDTIAVVGGIRPPTSTIVTATVVDSENNKVPGEPLTFTLKTNQGSWQSSTSTRLITDTGDTDSNGVVTKTLYGWNVPCTATIEVANGTLTKTIYVVVAGNPANVSVSASPPSIQVGGITTTVTAIVKDAFEHLVVDMPITFTTSGGTVSLTGTTTNGAATAVLTSSNTAGTVVVTATTPNGINGTTVVTYTPDALNSFTFDSFGSPKTVGVPFSVTVRARDQFNNVKTDYNGTVTLGCSGGCTVSPPSVTLVSGVAPFNATVTGQSGSGKALTAIDGGKSGISNVFTLNPGPPYTVSLTAIPAVTQTVGGTVDLTANVKDQSSNNIESAVVTFTASAGTVDPQTDTTDSSGNATAVLTGPATAQVVTVTAQADSVQSAPKTVEFVAAVAPTTDTIGVYITATRLFAYKNSFTGGSSDIPTHTFGPPDLEPIAGDWDGDGVDTVGVYDPAAGAGLFLLTDGFDGTAEQTFRFGPKPGMLPIAGDWNGDGVDTVGVYDPSIGLFLLTDGFDGVAEQTFRFGPKPGTLPIAGDWDAQ